MGTPYDEQLDLQVEAHFDMTGFPHWMLPPPSRGELNERSWEALLTAIASGDPLTVALRDHCKITDKLQYAKVLRWIHSNPDLEEQYIQAKKSGAEIKRAVMELRAAGFDEHGEVSIHDVARDALYVNTLRWLLGKDNREVYGEQKQIEQTVKLDISDAIREANARVERRTERVIQGEIVDE